MTAERDALAAQAGAARREEASDSKSRSDLAVHLRASRIRTADLLAENKRLVEEVRNLQRCVSAAGALSAETATHDVLIEELVAAKMRCAELEEENETFRRRARDALGEAAIAREASGLLEKSRSEWVLQCAKVEKEKEEIKAAAAQAAADAAERAGEQMGGEQKAASVTPPSTTATENFDLGSGATSGPSTPRGKGHSSRPSSPKSPASAVSVEINLD